MGHDSSGWEFLFFGFLSSLSGDRDQSPMFFLWLSTHLSSNLCLGVALVRLIFIYGDQLGQIWWEGLPQNIDGVLIIFSREEGSWGSGLDVHLTLTQGDTLSSQAEVTPQKQIWWLLMCCRQSVRTVWGALWIAAGAGSFTPLGWWGKRGFKLFGLLWLIWNTVDVS